ncbi:MAG TPA: nuclear transport factor 2 family protein [Baekduia sp.]|uniref:YybH family protein n=1 Tax=Baekduia sp. TaxID=2600305 RepID=UPI002BFC6CAE|nr:nuclear transport factor 2 family protein [Baekduia sp.]HMJ32788.1 nuclear transport factor 2 family protein [Baekduia sp.]
MTQSIEVRAAVQGLVAALDGDDADRYLAGLAPDVTFILPREAAPLRSREQLRDAWERWAADGNRLEACHAWELDVRAISGTLATATHVVSMHLAGRPDPVRQRETLVLQRDDVEGGWLVVHAHRSTHPYEWAGAGLPAAA